MQDKYEYDHNHIVIMGIHKKSDSYLGPLISSMFNARDFIDIEPQGLYTRLNVINSPWINNEQEDNNQYPGTVNYYNYKITVNLNVLL